MLHRGLAVEQDKRRGEVGGKDKQDLMARALAFLFPIDWPEPFGLVMIESMACGTPVIAWPNGSVPEIMEDGVTGFIVTSIEEAVQAVRKMSGVSRAGCRKAFEQRFSASRMARDYVLQYEHLQESADRAVPIEVRECL